MIVFRQFEFLWIFAKFLKIQKIMKMVKSARTSNRAKLGFTRVQSKPLEVELVEDMFSMKSICVTENSTFKPILLNPSIFSS